MIGDGRVESDPRGYESNGNESREALSGISKFNFFLPKKKREAFFYVPGAFYRSDFWVVRVLIQ